MFPNGIPPSHARCTIIEIDGSTVRRCILAHRHGWHCEFSDRYDQALCNETEYVYGRSVERVCRRPFDHLDMCMFLPFSERPVNRRERMRLPDRDGVTYILVREGE